jgi:N-acetylmuramic acid 6-phosphate etherase
MADEVDVVSPTEERLPESVDIDARSTLGVLQLINAEDAKVATAVAATLPRLAELVDATAERMQAGGRVHYFGAGTSGRLAVLDAAELIPTFNIPTGLVIAHHAGGAEALITAAENVEDSVELGREAAADLRPNDVAIGLTASGRTPVVGGALSAARGIGALTALVTSNPAPELAPLTDYLIVADTGSEVITGSTRLKAGTAQKMVLNAFSTALMIRRGRTWSNLMVDMRATNAKLRGRVVRILVQATGAQESVARAALSAADGELKPALLGLLAGVDSSRARELLVRTDGSVAAALRALNGAVRPASESGADPVRPDPKKDV